MDLFDGGPLRVLNDDGGRGVSALHELWMSFLIQICHSSVSTLDEPVYI